MPAADVVRGRHGAELVVAARVRRECAASETALRVLSGPRGRRAPGRDATSTCTKTRKGCGRLHALEQARADHLEAQLPAVWTRLSARKGLR